MSVALNNCSLCAKHLGYATIFTRSSAENQTEILKVRIAWQNNRYGITLLEIVAGRHYQLEKLSLSHVLFTRFYFPIFREL